MRSRHFRILGTLLIAVGLLMPQFATLTQAQSGGVDVNIWTQTTDGAPVYDICYQLGTYSNVGCDVNRDGAVFFLDMPSGSYLVTPSYPNGSNYYVEPFTIWIDANNANHLAIARSSAPASSQTQPVGSVDVLLLTRDPQTAQSLTDVCFELVGYSNIGCDENNDGRVSFAAIPYGTYTIRQTLWPNGYPKMNDYVVEIRPAVHSGPFTILLAQDLVQAPYEATNISVVFYDAGTNQLILNADNCAQVSIRGSGPISNVGCDEDIVDGQIDFMHVNIRMQNWSSHHTLDVFPACGYRVSDRGVQNHGSLGESTHIFTVGLEQTGANCR